ncbi:MAG: hypothetical protein AAFP19_06475, partial [Bacteroidota bacterium]
MQIKYLCFFLLVQFCLYSCQEEAPASNENGSNEPVDLPAEEEDYDESKNKWGFIDRFIGAILIGSRR